MASDTIVVHLYAKEGKEVEDKIRAKLLEASDSFCKDEGTLGWFVMQDKKDSRAWCIVERYAGESSLKIHVANPFYKKFGAFIGPLLAKPTDMRWFSEIPRPAAKL
ncbi:hypothetical protein B0H15DRAFT_831175 [Mycena belliarum]|uniref:ABM domain-containing protein n=1 Tax=Mycena belliarum TaxID=1033014 RepID=A0AAD6XT84_9AGAR|nr:hypothetical protein B0H15DRAFT_831175 [Mycena belliae]